MYIGVPGMLDEFTSGGRILNYSLLNRFIAQIRQQLLPTSSGSYQGRLYCVVPLLFQRFAGSAVPRVSEGGGAPSLVSTPQRRFYSRAPFRRSLGDRDGYCRQIPLKRKCSLSPGNEDTGERWIVRMEREDKNDDGDEAEGEEDEDEECGNVEDKENEASSEHDESEQEESELDLRNHLRDDILESV